MLLIEVCKITIIAPTQLKNIAEPVIVDHAI